MRYATFLVFVFWACYLSAQLNGKYVFRHIDHSDGLLHTNVRGIGQDARGFMWILTWNGLQRYDGSRFINYPQIINQSSFGVFHDSELYVDTIHQQVWVTKGKTMERLDLASGRMTTHSLEEILKDNATQKARLVYEENKQSFLAGALGFIRYDTSGENFLWGGFNINPAQSWRNTISIIDPITGDLWTHDFFHMMWTEQKSDRIYSSGDEHPTHPLLIKMKSLYGDVGKLRFIMMDSDHNLWISTWDHWLHKYSIDSGIFKTYSLKEIKKRQQGDVRGDNTLLINTIYEDRQKNIWFGTDYAGLVLYDKEKDDFNFITSDDKISNGLRYNFTIFSIFQDREDNLWLGTDRGISIFNPSRNYFQAIRHIDGVSNSLPKFDINDVIETSQGEILIGTWGGGISIYDTEWNFIRNVVFPGPVEHNLIWSFVESDDGTIWVGAQKGFIHLYDPVQKTFETIQPPELNNSTISAMAKDHDGNILIGLFNGLVAVYDNKENKFFAGSPAPVDSTLVDQNVVSILVDHSNRCWVTTSVGLSEFDIARHQFIHLYQPGVIDPVMGITGQGIEELNDSMLMIGASYEGLYLFNTRSKEFSRPSSDLKLDQESVYAIKKDRSGQIWFTTNFSLFRMNADLTDYTRFNIDHSVINTAFGSNHFYEMKDGRWLTSTFAEIVCFNPDLLGRKKRNPLHVEISGFKLLDENIMIDSFLQKNIPVLLPYDQNFFSIEFTALEYNGVQEINYYYRLSDIDKNWIHSTTKAFADYTDVKPGEYIFEVKADNGNGFSDITSIPITITPPWWGTIWFRLLVLFSTIALIYFLLKKRIQIIRKESALKHRMAETEMMALRSQMNPHFIFNCINGIDAMIQSNDKYRATMYLNKFAKLIRNVLDTSGQNKVSLSRDMETLQLYVDLELFRHPDKFTATIRTDEELLENDYKVPPLIIQPYVENAILHGLRHRPDQGGKLLIDVSKTKDHIVYVIEDNGVGRKEVNGDRGKNGKGYGMQMSSDRIQLFNEEEFASVRFTDLEADGRPSGTRVQVQLKIQ